MKIVVEGQRENKRWAAILTSCKTEQEAKEYIATMVELDYYETYKNYRIVKVIEQREIIFKHIK